MSVPAIRVLIQNGEHWLGNNGDLAMLDVTVRRLRRRWPDARIGVMTQAPWLLRAVAPTSEPILVSGRGDWPERATRLRGRVAERLGPGVIGPVEIGKLAGGEAVRRSAHRAERVLRRMTSAGISRSSDGGRRLPAALQDTSLVLAMGGGYFTDIDTKQTLRTLDLLEYAADHEIPTAMVGQGLGPLESPELLAGARRVLPRVDYIALRESVRGPDLLGQLGVAPERFTVTGDDAIALAHGVRQDRLGAGIGVCLRIADYSPVAAAARDAVTQVVQQAADRETAPLIPLIISEYHSEDRRSTMPLVENYEGNVVSPLGRFAGAQAVARRVSECRLVVTGAYHVAVFALSQGVPVVGLSSSEYYDDKFQGLRAMFGDDGIATLRLQSPDLHLRLSAAVDAAWRSAPDVRDHLRQRAVMQIRASEQAYDHIFDLVEKRLA